MTRRAHARIGGEKTGSRAYPTTGSLLCFALALWNGKDPILKERLFGLTNREGNHGEDVKEYYFYLDSTPTHSYMKYLYKYPQAAYPYDATRRTQRRRPHEFEYELIDTGVFDDDRYFDVLVEYAKASPEDILIQITVSNRGPEPATLHRAADDLVPQHLVVEEEEAPVRSFVRTPRCDRASHPDLGLRFLHAEDAERAPLHRERDERRADLRPPEPDALRQRRNQQLHRQRPSRGQSRPDRDEGVSALQTDGERRGIPGSPTASERPGPAANARRTHNPFGRSFDRVMKARRQEADQFYASVIPKSSERRCGQRDAPGARRHVVEQAALLLRRRQVARERGSDPFNRTVTRAAQRPLAAHVQRRHHLDAGQVGVPLVRRVGSRLPRHRPHSRRSGFRQGAAEADARARYLHPNGQIPAYEWNFGDVNPPVHAWSTIFTYRLEKARVAGRQRMARELFSEAASELHLVGQPQGPLGQNVFEGGFLGLDNIGVFDRSARFRRAAIWNRPTARRGWRSSRRTCSRSRRAGDAAIRRTRNVATKFVEHFLWIASSMTHVGGHSGMWDEEDGFFYDVLRLPDRRASAAASAIHGRPLPLVRGNGVRRRGARQISGNPGAIPRFLQLSA
jgi:hypothetical protein